MYRIVKRIVRTVTTVTWLVRWEKGFAGQETLEKEIAFPTRYSLMEEKVVDGINKQFKYKESNPILDKGENHENQ